MVDGAIAGMVDGAFRASTHPTLMAGFGVGEPYHVHLPIFIHPKMG
jgi:hypothetical protein